jgi:protein ImuB
MNGSDLRAETEGATTPLARRYLALWLPFLPTDRLQREARAAPDERPLALVEKQRGALRLTACDPRAKKLGLRPGLTLADARARAPELAAKPADPGADARLATRLAAWCEQFTPLVALDPPHGLALDITGCAQLFGGEEAMRLHVRRRLAELRIATRAGIAGTPDAARAQARFGPAARVAPGGEAVAARPLPIVALEEAPETLIALNRAGLTTLGALADRPSSALTARFGAALTQKLARILGHEDRRITPLRAPAACIVERRFAEPLLDLAGVEPAMRRLFGDAALLLERRGEGGRVFEMSFFRTDGATQRIVVETGQPSRDSDLLMRLYREKLDALADPLDPGFGFDVIRLAVPVSETFDAAQKDFDGVDGVEAALDALVDRLTARFGRERVLRFTACDTHMPERQARLTPAAGAARPQAWPTPEPSDAPRRPLQMFDPPQPIEVMAEIPDAPPASFRWRRVQHIVACAEGPERIEPEWWRRAGAARPEGLARDYYRVEDREGRRFWLFRAGLYERDAQPRWFLHGLFA